MKSKLLDAISQSRKEITDICGDVLWQLKYNDNARHYVQQVAIDVLTKDLYYELNLSENDIQFRAFIESRHSYLVVSFQCGMTIKGMPRFNVIFDKTKEELEEETLEESFIW